VKRIFKHGFSLVELMVVVTIIALLASIAIPRFLDFQAKAKQTEAKTNLSMIYTLQNTYVIEEDCYWPGAYGETESEDGAGGTSACATTGTAFSANDHGKQIEAADDVPAFVDANFNSTVHARSGPKENTLGFVISGTARYTYWVKFYGGANGAYASPDDYYGDWAAASRARSPGIIDGENDDGGDEWHIGANKCISGYYDDVKNQPSSAAKCRIQEPAKEGG